MELTPFKKLANSKSAKVAETHIEADLCLKYKPTKLEEFVGNKEGLNEANTWVLDAKSEEKLSILYGPPGIGKSLLLELFHKKYSNKMTIILTKDKSVEDIISILRGENQRTILESFKEPKITKDKLILIDDIDVKIQSEKEFMQIIAECVKRENCRVFCTASSNVIRKLNKIKHIKTIIFKRASETDLKKFINKIVRLERKRTSLDFGNYTFKQSNGDVRATIKNIEIALVKKSKNIAMDRDQEILTPDLVTELIQNKYKTFNEKYLASQCDTFSLIYSLHQNYVQSVRSLEQMADIADDFSMMDSLRNNLDIENDTVIDCVHGVCVPASRLSDSYCKEVIKPKKNITITPYKIISSSNQRIISKNKLEHAARVLKIGFTSSNTEMLEAVKLLAEKEKRQDEFTWFFTRFVPKKKLPSSKKSS